MIWNCNEVNYYGTIHGNGEETIVLLHGFTGSHRSWEPFIPLLATKYTVICVDLLGHGLTSAPSDFRRYAIELIAADLIELMNQEQLSKVHIVGYSMGGRVALSLASLYPKRIASLFLESTTPGLLSEIERKNRIESDELLAEKIEKEGLNAFVNYWEGIPLFSSQLNVEVNKRKALREERLSHPAIGLANNLRGMGTGKMPSWWEHIAHFDFPVMLVTGELDHKFSQIAKQMVERNVAFQHSVVEGAGHSVHFEKPETFAKLLMHFFSLN